MTVEIVSGRRRIIVNGERLSVRRAAPLLQLTAGALEKRILRGTPIFKPLQKRTFE